jgi:5-methylcytosine-specific restriction endonuclease McrA
VSEANARPDRLAHRTAAHRRLRSRVFRRDGHACVYCGAEDDLTLDYVTPLRLGGEMSMAIAVTACRSCNSLRTAVLGR